LQWILYLLNVPKADVDFLVQPASFLFIAIMVVASTRSFLLSISQASVHFPAASCLTILLGQMWSYLQLFNSWSIGVPANAVVLLLADVMGSYFIATVMTMRMSMPEHFRRGVTAAIGDLEFGFLHRFSDGIFIVAAILSSVLFLVSTALCR
jgi:hypothetical protein